LRGNCVLSEVEDLVNPTTGRWDEDLIIENFKGVYVNNILQIPLPNYGKPDFVAWHSNKT
jgi:hypothetical protein